MVIFSIVINNFCGFHKFTANFSYPKKIVNSSIEDEHLEGYEKMRYRKINILAGANASGKTSFGKVINAVFTLLGNKNPSVLTALIAQKEKDAEVEMDFNFGSRFFYRVNILCPGTAYRTAEPAVKVCVRYVPLKKDDTYEKCAERLDAIPLEYSDFDGSQLAGFSYFGWNFTFTEGTDSIKTAVIEPQMKLMPDIFNCVLKTLDPSVDEIIPVDTGKTENAFMIRFRNSDSVVVTNGRKYLDPDHVLSKGTAEGLEITYLIDAVLEHKNGFYYCDEKFSYIQSDVEKAILAVLIDNIAQGEQLFFTTHNLDLLDLDLPKHSFSFFRKNMNQTSPITLIHADEYIKKNNVSVRNAAQNDLFHTAPSTDLIFSLNGLAE